MLRKEKQKQREKKSRTNVATYETIRLQKVSAEE
jgi:hypothetical protein